MTDFNIEIIQQPSYSLDVTTGTSGVDSPTVEVVTSGGVYLEVSNRDKILPSDFPDNYPISYTTGLLPISRVSGLYSGSGIIFSSGLDGSLTINALAQNITLSGTSGISVSQSGNLYTIYTTGTFGLSSSQIQSLLNSGVSINVISGTGNFNSLSISGTPVSISGHSHTASSITDFNSSVSGLLPVKNILGSGYASVASSGGIFTVSVTGLQPSGNYSVSGHTHTSADITNFNSSVSGLLPITNIVGTSGASVTSSGTVFTVAVTGSFGLTTSEIQSLLNSGVSISVTGGTGNFNSLSVNSIPVSTSGHTHLSSSIIDFNSSVSGLLPVKNIVNSGYVSVSSSSGIFTIGVTGLQPSGDYSLVGHSHLVSDISNFGSGVSGLIPVKDILAGSGIQIGVTSGIYTVTAYGVAASSASSLITRCENRTGSTLPKMTAVYINGGHGNRPTIQKSIASSEAGSSKTYGITASQINNNSAGDVVVFGELIDVNTNQFGVVEGSTLYLSPSVSGNLTAIKPTAPNHMVVVGKIVRNHVSQGIIEVSIQNGFELEELHNVATTGAISGQFLKYDGSLWRNSGITSSDIGNFNSSVSGLLTPYAQLDDATFNALNVDTLFTCNTTNFFIDEDGNMSIGNGSQLVGAIVPNMIVTYGLSFASGIASSGLNVFNYLRLNNTDVSLSGHSHSLTIGSGSGTSITYDSSQTLNIIGSGNSEVLYNNSNKTVLISSPTANRGYEVLGSGKSIFAVDNGYVVGNIDVFYNGVKLLNGSDFTATNGTTFALAVSGIAGDVVEWTSFTTSPRYQVVMGEVRSDFVSGVNYIGNALQGSNESSSVWRIKKTTISSDGSILNNLTATNVRWTDRLIETYV